MSKFAKYSHGLRRILLIKDLPGDGTIHMVFNPPSKHTVFISNGHTIRPINLDQLILRLPEIRGHLIEVALLVLVIRLLWFS